MAGVRISNVIPAGVVNPFAGSSAPIGYLLCDGSSVSTTIYAALFAVVAYSYGGSGASFSLPDLQGRVPVGKGTAPTSNALNQNDGLVAASRAATHSHSVPKHKHAVLVSGNTDNTNVTHQHTSSSGGYFLINGGTSAAISVSSNNYSFGFSDNPTINHTHSLTNVAGTAGSTADPSGDSNLTSGSGSQPYIVLNYIIKT